LSAKYDDLTYEQRTFYELSMLDRAVPPFTHLFFAQRGVSPPTMLPEHKGAVIDWRLLGALTAVTTALTEGETPSATDITITNKTGTVAEYGAYIRYTKKLAMMGIDRVAAEASDALGEQAGDSLDQLVRDVIVAGTTVQYASTILNMTCMPIPSSRTCCTTARIVVRRILGQLVISATHLVCVSMYLLTLKSGLMEACRVQTSLLL